MKKYFPRDFSEKSQEPRSNDENPPDISGYKSLNTEQ